MARRSRVDPSTLTVDQVDRSLRAWHRSVTVSTVCCAGVAAIAFAFGLTIFGAIMVLVGLIGAPLSWRLLTAEHAKLRAKATGNPFGSGE
jgi:Flp pilus assembly protein TadB